MRQIFRPARAGVWAAVHAVLAEVQRGLLGGASRAAPMPLPSHMQQLSARMPFGSTHVREATVPTASEVTAQASPNLLNLLLEVSLRHQVAAGLQGRLHGGRGRAWSHRAARGRDL